MANLLELRQVSYAYPGQGQGHGAQLFDRLDLAIPAGAATALMGPSGGGKSTLGRLLARVVEPTGGRVHWDPTLATPRDVIYVDQDPSNVFFPWLDVRRNVRDPLEALGEDRHSAERETTALLALVELESLASSYPVRLSGGEQQRLALARALACRPRAMVLDESFSALDPATRRRVLQRLAAQLQARGTTIVLVTHDIGDVGVLASRCVILRGRPASVATEFELPYATSERLDDHEKLDAVQVRVAQELAHALA